MDVLSSLDAGMNARDDVSHLIFASAQCRALISAIVRDFVLLHREWVEQGRSHSGVLIIPQQRYPTGEIVRRMLRVASSRLDLANGFFYLSNF